MKTIGMNHGLAGIVGVTTLLLASAAPAASPGMGWDEYFYTGEILPVASSSYQSSATREFDVFNSGTGASVEDFSQAYMGTSQPDASGDGWDVFHTGQGDPLP